MEHPTFLDKIKLKFNRYYLYPGQLTQPVSNLSAALVHKVYAPSHWKIMDYISLKKGSILKYLGSGKDFKSTGDLLPTHSLFEIVEVTSDRHTGIGDIIALTPADRKFLTHAAFYPGSDQQSPTYFTAENQ